MARPKPKKPPVTTTMRLDTALKEALAKAALADGRTSTSLAAKILGDWLKERGYLK
ncbi:MAG: hypothetical protein ACREDT_15455 [Methylocella sp.]